MLGARGADVVLPCPLFGDLSPLDHSFDTYSLRCWRTRLWAGFLAQFVLLLLFLFDDQTSNTGEVEGTMGFCADDRDGTVGVGARVVNLEHE